MIPALALAIPLLRGTAMGFRARPAAGAAASAGPSHPRVSTAEPDPEVLRIERALRAVEQDPRARQQFYADVDSLVRSVRSGQPIPRSLTLDRELALPADRAPASSGTAGLSQPEHRVGERLVTAHSEQLMTASAPSEPGSARSPDFGPQSPKIAGGQPRSLRLLSPNNNPLDPGVVSRITYWAQVNGCPIELALAVAWQDSGMNLHPARGSSGEIGIMQIMPERARLEAVDPSSLYDPEMNLWLGTKLLARYYGEEGSVARAAMKYVAGPGVFEKHYPPDMRDYISWYSASVDNYARYFGRHVNF